MTIGARPCGATFASSVGVGAKMSASVTFATAGAAPCGWAAGGVWASSAPDDRARSTTARSQVFLISLLLFVEKPLRMKALRYTEVNGRMAVGLHERRLLR